MKTTRFTITAFIALAATAAALVAKQTPGPKGGRILTADAPHAEFFVAKDRHVIVSFYDGALKPLPVSERVVAVTAEAKTGKVKLEFAEKDGVFVSNAPLPEGDDYNVVVQVRESANGRPKNYRVPFHDKVCHECGRAEYACVCDDTGDEHGHDHKKNA